MRGVQHLFRVLSSLSVVGFTLLAAAISLSAQERLALAQSAYQECRIFFEQGEYPRAEARCNAARSFLRGSTANQSVRELLKAILGLLNLIKQQLPEPMYATVVFPVAKGTPGPPQCVNIGGCQATIPAEVLQFKFPGPVGSAALLPPRELQAALRWQAEDTGSYYLLPGIAVRSGLTKWLEVGGAWGHYLSTVQPHSNPDPETTVDAKVGLLHGHGLLPRTALVAGLSIPAWHAEPFAAVIAQYDLPKGAIIRYSAGRMWKAGILQEPFTKFFKFGEFITNPNKERAFAIWNYGAAIDWPIIAGFRGSAEWYGGAALYVEHTNVFGGGLTYTFRDAAFRVTYGKRISNFPESWNLGLDLIYHVRWYRRPVQ